MSSVWESFAKNLQRFDAYPKTLEDFRVKTFTGATVTVIAGFIMVMLLISELQYYRTIELQSELYVDMSQGHKLKINLNVTFPHLPCGFVGLDAIDVSGKRQLNIAHTLLKQRLNKDGSFVNIKAELVDVLGVTASTENVTAAVLNPNRCESCYGAETNAKRCCNTCSDIKEAYRRKGWAFPPDAHTTMEQCKREKQNKPEFNIDEGCLIYGHLEVNKVAGNFHISPGKSYEVGHAHVHDLADFGDQNKINVSHVINHLSFGTSYPGQIHPLNDLKAVAPSAITAFNYYIKIVPTTYISLNGTKVRTNQFSVTRHTKEVRDEGLLPGMFVSYELSPLMVRYTEKTKSFLHFLTSVCAIVGGIFTVAGILDSFIYRGSAALKKKIELGKFT